MKLLIRRIPMAGCNFSYFSIAVPIEDCPNYSPTAFITEIDIHGRKVWAFKYATVHADHFKMPLGYDRYMDFCLHEKEASRNVFEIVLQAYPEYEGVLASYGAEPSAIDIGPESRNSEEREVEFTCESISPAPRRHCTLNGAEYMWRY